MAVAEGKHSTKVSVRVRGRGQRRVLRYRVTPAEGERIRFVEQGARSYTELGVAKGRSGASASRLRPVASDDARLPKPRRVRVKRRRDAITVSWRRARGVKSYGVVVRLSNKRRIFRVVNRPRLTLRGFHRLARGKVLVQSLRAGEPSSRPATARIRAVRRTAGRR